MMGIESMPGVSSAIPSPNPACESSNSCLHGQIDLSRGTFRMLIATLKS